MIGWADEAKRRAVCKATGSQEGGCAAGSVIGDRVVSCWFLGGRVGKKKAKSVRRKGAGCWFNLSSGAVLRNVHQSSPTLSEGGLHIRTAPRFSMPTMANSHIATRLSIVLRGLLQFEPY